MSPLCRNVPHIFHAVFRLRRKRNKTVAVNATLHFLRCTWCPHTRLDAALKPRAAPKTDVLAHRGADDRDAGGPQPGHRRAAVAGFGVVQAADPDVLRLSMQKQRDGTPREWMRSTSLSVYFMLILLDSRHGILCSGCSDEEKSTRLW